MNRVARPVGCRCEQKGGRGSTGPKLWHTRCFGIFGKKQQCQPPFLRSLGVHYLCVLLCCSILNSLLGWSPKPRENKIKKTYNSRMFVEHARTGDPGAGLRRSTHRQPCERPQQISQRLFHAGTATRTTTAAGTAAGASRVVRATPAPRHHGGVRHLGDQCTRARAQLSQHGGRLFRDCFSRS